MVGGSTRPEATEGSRGGGWAEGCGELAAAAGGGRGQLPELGRGVASRAGSVTNEPSRSHTRYYTDTARGEASRWQTTAIRPGNLCWEPTAQAATSRISETGDQ